MSSAGERGEGEKEEKQSAVLAGARAPLLVRFELRMDKRSYKLLETKAGACRGNCKRCALLLGLPHFENSFESLRTQMKRSA